MAKSNSAASTPPSDNGQEVANKIKREESVDHHLAQELSSTSVTTTGIKDERSDSARQSLSSHAPHIKTSRSPSPSSKIQPALDEIDVKPKLETNGNKSPTKVEMGKKPSRAAAKAPPRVAPLFDSLPDVTPEATSSFQVIDSSTYQNKYLGFTEAALECDCSEEWGKSSYSWRVTLR
jgi:[histone H3]-lysine36 N-trimethyltransferase